MVTDNLLDNLLQNSDKINIDLKQADELLEPLLSEINQIEDATIKSFVRSLLIHAPAFFYVPVTQLEDGGLYPPDEYLEGGLVRHTKRVFMATKMLCESQGRVQPELDIAMAAALLHDITRMIPSDNDFYQEDPYHPITIDRYIEYVELIEADESLDSVKIIDEEILSYIVRMIHTHLGPWGPIAEVLPLNSLEWILHFADRIAARSHALLSLEE